MNPVLREARSSPYIGEEGTGGRSSSNAFGLTMRMQSAGSDERFERLKEAMATDSVHFNADSSSSSTDLLQYCSESMADADAVRQWVESRGRRKEPAEQREMMRTGGRQQSGAARNRSGKADSAGNLAGGSQSQQSSMSELSTTTAQDTEPTEPSALGKHRSETNLPGKASREGFRLLEKCCSVELGPSKALPPSRLARSKEMPNIADVDDCELATYDC